MTALKFRAVWSWLPSQGPKVYFWGQLSAGEQMAADYRIRFEWFDLAGVVRLNSSSRVLLTADGSRAVCEAAAVGGHFTAVDLFTLLSVVLCLAHSCNRKTLPLRQPKSLQRLLSPPRIADSCTQLPPNSVAVPPPRRCVSAIPDLAPC